MDRLGMYQPIWALSLQHRSSNQPTFSSQNPPTYLHWALYLPGEEKKERQQGEKDKGQQESLGPEFGKVEVRLPRRGVHDAQQDVF